MDKETSDISSISMDLEQCRLADAARDHFSKKNYDACLKNLAKIEATKEIRKKVAHNKAVARFYKSGLKKYVEFRKSLDDIIGELPNTSVEAFDIKDLSLAVPLFNKAVIHYQLRQPLAAWKSLHVLLKHLDALDTQVAQKIGLLAIQLMLNLYQSKKADAIITLLKVRLCSTADLFGGKEGDELELKLEKALDLSDTVKSLEQFKWMFRLYEMRSKVMNGKAVVIPPEGTPEMLVLKAHQYYVGHDYQMAAKELVKKPVTTLSNFLTNGEEYNSIIANNMGLIHFHVRHYAIAVQFFQTSINFDDNATKEVAKDLAIHYIGASKQPEILYNLGVAMLHLKRPKDAFKCLLVPLKYYHNNAKLWLRLAEACIMTHEQNENRRNKTNLVSSVGSGSHCKYFLRPTPSKYMSGDKDPRAFPSPNLEFASFCLRNALSLVEHYENEFNSSASAEGSSKWNQMHEKTKSNPSPPITHIGVIKLKYAVLAAYSYVNVCLGEYIIAMEYAETLLSLPDLPEAYKVLGNLYCAESMIMLDRCHEARAYLDPKFIAGLKEDDFILRAVPEWTIDSLSAAQSVMEYNLCVLLVIQGERDLAKSYLSRCTHPSVQIHLKLLKIFLEMSDGNFDKCRKIILMDPPYISEGSY